MILSFWSSGEWFVWFVFLAFYFIPTLVAWNKKNFAQVLALNLFLGWTFIGWVLSLVFSLKKFE